MDALRRSPVLVAIADEPVVACLITVRHRKLETDSNKRAYR
jgi:hypothetical protein